MPTILVVDDEPDLETLIRQKFRRQIRSGEFEFLSAHNGVEALDVLADRSDVAVALCDINMPKMDGLTLLEHMGERFPLVKPVIISAYGDMDNIRGAMNRGAFDFLTKPIELRDLEVTVGRALAQAERVQQMIRSLQENHLLKMFVSDAVYRHLSQCKSEEQVRRSEVIDASVAFFDVCGFSRLSEREPPERVVELLDTYFDRIVAAVADRGGFVDKFIGDAVMAVFREPGHAARALAAAIAAREAVAAAGRGFQAAFGLVPPIAIGVHTGTMLACSVGARSLARFDFTVIGDAVNIAARLEEAAGDWQIFASEATCGLGGAGLRLQDRGMLAIKGKVQELKVLEVEPPGEG